MNKDNTALKLDSIVRDSSQVRLSYYKGQYTLVTVTFDIDHSWSAPTLGEVVNNAWWDLFA